MSKRSLRAEREFGLIVGGVLVLLSTWWFYRGKFHAVAPVTISIGGLLILLGLVFPRALTHVKGWGRRAASKEGRHA